MTPPDLRDRAEALETEALSLLPYFATTEDATLQGQPIADDYRRLFNRTHALLTEAEPLLRELLAEVDRLEKAVRCDCGGPLIHCHACAVADYQAQHTACATCCPPAPCEATPDRVLFPPEWGYRCTRGAGHDGPHEWRRG